MSKILPTYDITEKPLDDALLDAFLLVDEALSKLEVRARLVPPRPTRCASVSSEPHNLLVRPLRSIFSSRPQIANAVARSGGQDRPSLCPCHTLGADRLRLE
jgi:hypothetical protein